MCGIVSYIGHQDPIPILIKGLRRLEYRGYDSAGLALLDGKNLNSVKKAGKVSDLSDKSLSNMFSLELGNTEIYSFLRNLRNSSDIVIYNDKLNN